MGNLVKHQQLNLPGIPIPMLEAQLLQRIWCIVVNDINSRDCISFVIVSGDISVYDIGQNLILAKAIPECLTVPYHIIPGNHATN